MSKALPIVHLPPTRFAPSKETLAVLNDRPWVASYSGGKDSTALVTWIEYLRRAGWVRGDVRPRLVQAGTGVEYPFLDATAARLTAALAAAGWECDLVEPGVNELLYTQIFGRGLPPVHPGSKRFRWCTRSTKTDPMARFAWLLGPDVVQLTGIRWGESDRRDGQLKSSGCQAGGECGLPEPGEGKYAPIVTWKTCQVVEWLNGDTGPASAAIGDLVAITRDLVAVYEIKTDGPSLWDLPPKVSGLRFGCIGCPAISTDKIMRSRQARQDPRWQHLRRIYGVWEQLYKPSSRLVRVTNGTVRMGPLRMAVRQRYFAELLEIQRDAGVVLVTSKGEAFVRACWERKVYPQGWSEADEATEPPATGLFATEGAK